MTVNKLPEFAKNGQKNTDGLTLEDGFPVNLKPARQWFNFLFNELALSINQIIDEKLDKTANAVSASKLKESRKINTVDFDGTKDISISAPMRYLKTVNSSTVNQAIDDGYYLVTDDNNLAGLYGYGVLEVRAQGRVIHQTYFAHMGEFRVAVRQTWDEGQSYSPWLIVGSRSTTASKLQTPRKIFGQDFDGSSDVSGNITANTGLLLADARHFIDMGRDGVDRMNFHSFGGVFNFINAENGNILARLNWNGIDCNAASATKLQNSRKIFGHYFDGSTDVSGDVITNTGLLLADARHFIDMGRDGVDRMNFHSFGGVFNFINAENGNILARLNWNGIDCNAATASKLKNPRKINDVNFDGTGDINISAPLQFLGDTVYPDNATTTGFYTITGANIAGLYDYGVLDVRQQRGVIHQTYYAHQNNGKGSVAVRQSWDGGQNFSPWRSLDPIGSVTLSGAVSGSANFDGSGNIIINTALNQGFGVGQTRQNLTMSRFFGTTYTNTTAKPRFVSVTSVGGNSLFKAIVEGEEFASNYSTYNSGEPQHNISVMVLPGESYSFTGGTKKIWWEIG